MLRESETVALKAIVVDDIKKEIIAFANSSGGKLYVGVDDAGNALGVADPDEVIQRITNMVRDAIKPDVTMFVRYDIVDMDGKSVVVAYVQRGSERPYYLAGKGIRPEGVHVRQGTSSVPATASSILRMIKESDGDSYEELRSLEQELTFLEAEKAFKRRNLEFGTLQYKTLGILNPDGIYTNLGLLLSDQCVHTVKAATFQGNAQEVFKDRHEFSGSLLKQLNDAYAYIDLRNRTRSTFDKLLRIDVRDYPEVAVREALLNSLVHRDYSYRASTMIGVYDDRIELITIGGLIKGGSLEDIMLGLSACRNEKLANVFYRLQLIEAYGTGMRKIMKSYGGSSRKPRMVVTDNAFKIILPNMNEVPEEGHANDLGMSVLDQILNQTEKKGAITRKDVEALLDCSQTVAGRLLRELCEKKQLVQIRKGKNTEYCLA